MKTVKLRSTLSMTTGSFFTTDAIKSAVTHEEGTRNAERVAELIDLDLGMIWTGILQSGDPAKSLDAMPEDIKGQLRQKYGAIVQQLSNYAKASGASSELETPVTIQDRRAAARDGAASAAATRDLMRSINDGNRRLWSGAAVNPSAPARDATSRTVHDINAQNRRFWEEQTRS